MMINFESSSPLKVTKMNIQPLDFFMLRRPMLAADLLFDFHLKITQSPESFETELMDLFSKPILREAIYLASPALDGALSAWQKHGASKAHDKMLSTLYKYLIRMCTRATPFGLFAGFTTGRFSDCTLIRFDAHAPFTRSSRPDMAIAGLIADYLKKQEHILNQSVFYPNSSLYKIGSTARFVARSQGQKDAESLLCATPNDSMLEKIITGSKEGATLKQMVALLLDQTTRPHAKQYVLALIRMQVLVCELDMNVTGEPYLDVLARKLKKMKGTAKQIRYLKDIRSLSQGPIRPLHTHQQWTGLLLKTEINLINKTPIQTDVRFNTVDCQISRHALKILTREFVNISGLYQADYQNFDLLRFKQDFFQRYENKQVPLLEAIDCESGVGYGPLVPGHSDRLELLEKLSFPSPKPPFERPTALSRLKEKLAGRCQDPAAFCVTLTEDDLFGLQKEQGTKKMSTATSLYWLGSFITRSPQALDAGHFQFLLKSIGGASGLELLGRFCHADPRLTALTAAAAAAQQTQRPDAILAEIAHLPDWRAANILARPHLRHYEIVYLAGGNLPPQQQIHAEDLLISVAGGKQIVLTSKRLNKRIIPCMATAHNVDQGLPVYKFLADLARQQNPSYADWHWGEFDKQVFLPRLEYKHFVISRATWNIDKDSFPSLFQKSSSFNAQWARVAASLSIPRFFQLCQQDQELLIDSSCDRSLKLLGELMASQQRVRLVEWLHLPGQDLLGHQKQTYVHEIVIPFGPEKKTVTSTPDSLPPARPLARPPRISFAVGSPWLYVRIYSGTSTAEHILTDLLGGFCSGLIKEELIEKWFYIRYQDPSPHIRIRFFHSSRPDFWSVVLKGLSTLLEPLSNLGIVSSLQTDTYTREHERYAEMAYSDVESIFYHDSCAALEILQVVFLLDTAQSNRWLTGLYGADLLMDALGLPLPQKRMTIQKLYDQFFTEFEGTKDLTVQLNTQYRSHKAAINSFMKEPLTACEKIYNQRSQRIQTVLSASQPISAAGSCALAGSFVHLFFNRLFSSEHRRQELVMYHYLNKYYNTLINTDKKK